MIMNITEVQASDNSPDIECKMSITSPQALDKGIWLSFSVQNNRDNNIELLSWYTPFEGFLSNLFKITNDVGVLLNYQGMMVKRLSPEASEFLLIPAHTKHEIQIELSKGYRFSQGKFSIELMHRRIRYKNSSEKLDEFICSPNPLTVYIED